jgi:hypothetical protein
MGYETVSLKLHNPTTVHIVEFWMRWWLSTSVIEIGRSRPLSSELTAAHTIRLIHHPPKGSSIFQRAISADGLYNHFQCQRLTRTCASVSLKLKAGCGLSNSG